MLKIILFSLLICCFLNVLQGRGDRKESAVDDEMYEMLLKIIKAKGKSLGSVRERTALEKNALVRYYRYCKKHKVTCSDANIYLDGKKLLRKSEVAKFVRKVVELSKGTSARYCARKIAISSVGASTKGVQRIIEGKKKVYLFLKYK